jgi:hypothetical protein
MCRHVSTRQRFVATFAICGLAGVAPAADAQLIQQYFPTDIPGYAPDLSGSVVQRMLSRDQSQGVEVGDFVVRPQLSESAGYKSDILGTGHSGSSSINNSASVRLNSDWDRDALGASFSVDNQLYPELPVANQTNWSAGIGGSLDLGNDTATAAYSHLALHLNATDLGVEGVVNPVPYTVDNVRLSYSKLLGRFDFIPSFEYRDFNFGHSDGAAVINYDALNHRTESEALSSLYQLSQGNSAVVLFRVTQAQFGHLGNNNYTDEGGFLGLDFRGESVIQYRLLGGVESRQFSASTNGTITTPTFQLDAVWMPTRLDTVTLTGFRHLEDPTSPFSLNQIVSTGRLELDHELRQNVFLRANASVGKSVAQSNTFGVAEGRQTQWQLGASAFWNINRRLRGTLSYAYSEGKAYSPNNNTAEGRGFANFSSSSVMLGITLFE